MSKISPLNLKDTHTKVKVNSLIKSILYTALYTESLLTKVCPRKQYTRQNL
jgi:hypothetical protein